jgi:hypothetical protein
LEKWFTSNRNLKLRVEKTIRKDNTFTITKLKNSILDQRLEMKNELLSLLQKIRVFGQVLYGPIVEPIIQVFLSQRSSPKIEFAIKL